LHDAVCNHLNLVEGDYFGLEFPDHKKMMVCRKLIFTWFSSTSALYSFFQLLTYKVCLILDFKREKNTLFKKTLACWI